MPNGIVYLVTNAINKMLYVGATIRPLASRWRAHCRDARIGSSKAPLHIAIRTLGVDVFNCRAIDSASVGTKLQNLEKAWIFLMNSFAPMGYNQTDGGIRGTKHSAEMRVRVGNATKRHWKDPEYRNNLLKAMKQQWTNPAARKQRSDLSKKMWSNPVTRKKLLAARKSQWLDPTYRKNTLDAQRAGRVAKKQKN